MKLISLSEMARKYLSGPPMEELIRWLMGNKMVGRSAKMAPGDMILLKFFFFNTDRPD